jgi:S1-C subfamily serine protease
MRDRSPRRTRRWLAVAAGVVVLLALSSGAYLALGGRLARPSRVPPPLSASALVARARLATVTVRVELFRSGTRDGQGFVIDRRGIVVTSAYLLRQAATVSVIDGHGVTMDAGLIGLDDITGVAELLAPQLASTRLALGPEKAAAGAHVLLPAGPPASVATADIAGVGQEADVGTHHITGLVELAGTAIASSSGEPVLDRQGRVVAVAVVAAPTAGHLFAAPVWPALTELAAWSRDPVVESFTPPLVTADVHTLTLQVADLPAGFQVSGTSDVSQSTSPGLEVTFTSSAAGLSQSSFVAIFPSVSAAKSGYQTYIDDQTRAGYAASDTAVQLGDQAILNTKRDPAPSGGGTVDRFQVIWRDRNVVGIAELVAYTGFAHPNVLDLAGKQEARIAADPPSD